MTTGDGERIAPNEVPNSGSRVRLPPEPSGARRRGFESPALGRHLLLVAFFALVGGLLLYWPLFHSGTHVPGNRVTDYHLAHWSLWWIRKALTTPGLSVYETNYVMFPFTSNLAFHTLGAFWFPLWALLEPLIGTLAAVNAIFWVAATLRGYTFFLLLRREGVSHGLALLGGVMLQVTPVAVSAVFWSNVDLLGWFWLPVHLLLWGQAARTAAASQPQTGGLNPLSGPLPTLWALALGIAFWAAAMTDLQYLLFTAFLLVPYGLWTLYVGGTRHAVSLPGVGQRWRTRGRLVMLGLLAVLTMVVLLWFVGPLRPLLAYDLSAFLPADVASVEGIPFPEGFLRRPEVYWLNPSVGLVWTVAVLASLIVGLGFRRRDRPERGRVAPPDERTSGPRPAPRWFWFALIVTPLILSVGPAITIFGMTVPMPYRWFHAALGGIFRYPGRFGPVLVMAGMIFAGQVWTPLLARWRPRGIRPLIVGALLIALLADLRVLRSIDVTPPLTPYAFYETMGAETGDPYDDYVVVEAPVAAGTGVMWIGEFDDTAFQFYGLTHGKRMVNGLLSRTDPNFYYVLRDGDPVLSWLGGRRWLEPEVVRRELRRRIYEWPIGYLVVHQDRIGREGPTVQEILGYLNSLGDLLCPFAVEGDAVAYRTAWHPDGCPPRIPPEVAPGVYQIDLGSAGDERYIGWGWHWPEAVFDVTLRWIGDQRWTADDPRADLYVDLPPGDYALSLAAQAFWEARDLRIVVNGTPLATVTVPEGALHEFAVEVPAAVLGDGRHVTVTLAYNSWDVPVEVGQSADERFLAVAVDWVRFSRAGGAP